MTYIYESHLGGIYFSDYEEDYDDLYCEECGDYDWIIYTVNSLSEAWECFKAECDIDGNGGWSLEYIVSSLILEFMGGDRIREIDREYIQDVIYQRNEKYLSQEQWLEMIQDYIDVENKQ